MRSEQVPDMPVAKSHIAEAAMREIETSPAPHIRTALLPQYKIPAVHCHEISRRRLKPGTLHRFVSPARLKKSPVAISRISAISGGKLHPVNRGGRPAVLSSRRIEFRARRNRVGRPQISRGRNVIAFPVTLLKQAFRIDRKTLKPIHVSPATSWFISVPAKWIRTSRRYVLNIYTCNNAYADSFQTDFG